MSRRVSFSPDIDGMPSPPLYFGGDRANTTEPMIKILAFRPPKKTSSSSSSAGFSAMRFLGRIKAKLSKALGFVSSSSRKVSSSSSTTSSSGSFTLERSRSYVETFDSHRAQAVEDCIQFLNSSSSSFQRSKSISTFSY